MMSFSKILPAAWLLVGAQPNAEDCQQLYDEQKVRSLLSMNAEDNFLDAERRVFGNDHVLHINWHDDQTPKPVSDFAKILDWYRALPAGYQRIYVHCWMGHNRGPLAATWLLMAIEGESAYDAWTLMKSRRPYANFWNIPAYRFSLLRAERELLHRKSV